MLPKKEQGEEMVAVEQMEILGSRYRQGK